MLPKKENFTISRKFNAPKEMVFHAFSEADSLAQWWGPKEMPITVAKLEFKPQGKFHYKMEGSNGQTMWGLFVYVRIRKPDLIEFVSSFSDENSTICPAPFDMPWPLEIFNSLTLTETAGITTLTLSCHPVNATKEQERTYYSFFDSMSQGFTNTLDQLEKYLAKQ